MKSSTGASIGVIGGPLVAAAIVFVWGGLEGAAPCGRAPFFEGGFFAMIMLSPFYAAPAGLFGAAAGALWPIICAHLWGRSPGCCARCGYDLRGSIGDKKAVCPECGETQTR